MGAEYLSQHHQMNVTSIKTKYKSNKIRWSFNALSEVLFSYFMYKNCAVSHLLLWLTHFSIDGPSERGGEKCAQPKQIPFREILWALFYNFRKISLYMYIYIWQYFRNIFTTIKKNMRRKEKIYFELYSIWYCFSCLFFSFLLLFCFILKYLFYA